MGSALGVLIIITLAENFFSIPLGQGHQACWTMCDAPEVPLAI